MSSSDDNDDDSSSSDQEADDPKIVMAKDLRRLFDIHEMAYTVMIRSDPTDDGKEEQPPLLTPDRLVAAIEKDSMFGEDLEEYRSRYCNGGGGGDDVTVLAVGKCADDGMSSEPLPDEAGLTIPGSGTYLVHLSFAEGVLATMRVVVD